MFASGSPFDPVTIDGNELVPGQGNNAYVFPGIGLGVIAAQAHHVTDEMFSVAATTLADMASDACLDEGCIYPPFASIREVSCQIAMAVAEVAYEQQVAGVKRPADLEAFIRAAMWQAEY